MNWYLILTVAGFLSASLAGFFGFKLGAAWHLWQCRIWLGSERYDLISKRGKIGIPERMWDYLHLHLDWLEDTLPRSVNWKWRECLEFYQFLSSLRSLDPAEAEDKLFRHELSQNFITHPGPHHRFYPSREIPELIPINAPMCEVLMRVTGGLGGCQRPATNRHNDHHVCDECFKMAKIREPYYHPDGPFRHRDQFNARKKS